MAAANAGPPPAEGTKTAGEAEATAAGATVRARTTALVPNAASAIDGFIVTSLKGDARPTRSLYLRGRDHQEQKVTIEVS